MHRVVEKRLDEVALLRVEIFYDFVVKQRDDERYENRDKDRRDRDKFYLGVAYLFLDDEKMQLALM